MTADHPFNRFLARYPYAAVAAYGILAVVFIVVIVVGLASIFEQRAALSNSQEILDQLEARQQHPEAADSLAGAIPSGSPVLSGDTITVAGATLLQRVASAISRFGGSVQSSQVDLQGPRSKDGFIALVISCEIDQANLQKLLYDLEAGMPYLFVDQLDVQGPHNSVIAGGSRLRVLLSVSGEWKGAK